MQLGLVTYLWGAEWDLPTLLANCEETGFLGVELRSTHKHGVEPTLDEAGRGEVAKRFADSGVTLVGLGSACEYHAPDSAELKRQVEDTKAFVVCCHDIGAGGVKVRPNGLPQDVPMEKTIEQIGTSLNTVAAFAEGFAFAFGAALGLGAAFGFALAAGFGFGSAFGFAFTSPAPTGASRAMVLIRAMSRRICRTRAVFSNWPEAAWKRRLNCSFFSLISSSES